MRISSEWICGSPFALTTCRSGAHSSFRSLCPNSTNLRSPEESSSPSLEEKDEDEDEDEDEEALDARRRAW